MKTIVLLVLLCVPAAAQVYDPPGGCRNGDGSQRACEWYERSYLMPKAQQEQLLRVYLERETGGILNIENEAGPAPRIVDDTAAVKAMTDGQIDTAGIAAELGITRSRVLQLAKELQITVRLVPYRGTVARVYTVEEAQQIADRYANPRKTGPRLGSKRGVSSR